MGKRVPLKPAGPSSAAEAILAILLPPACREEVLGDLHERYVAPAQYAFEGLRTVPLVILSRIRRTADPQVLLMHAFALYVAFAGAAWAQDRAFLGGEGHLLHLAVPVAAVLLGIVLEDAYAKPGQRPPLMFARGPAMGIALALFVEVNFLVNRPLLAIPSRMFLYGSAMSLLLCSAVRLLFPPVANQLQGATAPAFWLKQTGGTIGHRAILVLKSVAALMAIALTATWLSSASGVPLPRVLAILMLAGLLLRIGYQVSKRV